MSTSKILVVVTTESGKRLRLKINPRARVLALKCLVQRMDGIPIDRITLRLPHVGKTLQDRFRMSDVGATDWWDVDMILGVENGSSATLPWFLQLRRSESIPWLKEIEKQQERRKEHLARQTQVTNLTHADGDLTPEILCLKARAAQELGQCRIASSKQAAVYQRQAVVRQRRLRGDPELLKEMKFQLGLYEFYGGNLRKAKTVFGDISLARNPEAMFFCAECSRMLDDAGAPRLYRQASISASSNLQPILHARLAQMHCERRDFRSCFASCAIALQLVPDLALALCIRGLAGVLVDDPDGIDFLNEGIRVGSEGPEFPELLYLRARAHKLLGNVTDAIGDLLTIVDLDEMQPDAGFFIGIFREKALAELSELAQSRDASRLTFCGVGDEALEATHDKALSEALEIVLDEVFDSEDVEGRASWNVLTIEAGGTEIRCPKSLLLRASNLRDLNSLNHVNVCVANRYSDGREIRFLKILLGALPAHALQDFEILDFFAIFRQLGLLDHAFLLFLECFVWRAHSLETLVFLLISSLALFEDNWEEVALQRHRNRDLGRQKKNSPDNSSPDFVPNCAFTLACLNLLFEKKADLEKPDATSLLDALAAHGAFLLVVEHESIRLDLHPEFDELVWEKKLPQFSFRSLAFESLKDLHESSSEFSDIALKTQSGLTIQSHLLVLVHRSMFFRNMICFAGSERRAVIERRCIPVDVLSDGALCGLVEYAYTKRVHSIGFDVLLPLACHAEIFRDKALKTFILMVIRWRTRELFGNGTLKQEIAANAHHLQDELEMTEIRSLWVRGTKDGGAVFVDDQQLQNFVLRELERRERFRLTQLQRNRGESEEEGEA